MGIDRLYTRSALATTCHATLAEAAAAMHRYRVGSLLVMKDGEPESPAAGIVTDRDLALYRLAVGDQATVDGAMTPVVATIREDADIHEALETMRAHGVRRLVVTDAAGAIRGMLSVDDVIDGLSADLASAAAVLKGEIRHDSAGLGEVRV
ncbi:MAG TPA: CBS domain-containing protein [Usitatibacter sp.]|nr:CBS domain-containing protein [Usitatibacter sp.]